MTLLNPIAVSGNVRFATSLHDLFVANGLAVTLTTIPLTFSDADIVDYFQKRLRAGPVHIVAIPNGARAHEVGTIVRWRSAVALDALTPVIALVSKHPRLDMRGTQVQLDGPAIPAVLKG
jgi:hypothetical protein